MFKKHLLTILSFLVIGAISALFFDSTAFLGGTIMKGQINPLARETSPAYRRLVDQEIKKTSECLSEEGQKERIVCINDRLRILSKEHGPRFALDVIQPLSQENPFILGFNHDLAHTIGDAAIAHDYQNNAGDFTIEAEGFTGSELEVVNKIGRALVECDGWGAFGCYHGVIEIGLSKIPPSRRTDVVKVACMQNPLIQKEQYYANQCLHWFGHGMAIFTDQTLKETLGVCEGLTTNFATDEVQLCLSGVFHAGAAPGTSDVDYLDNLTRVYDKNDPFYPCLEVEERFQGHCYSHVPGRTPSGKLSEIYENCNNIPEPDPKKKSDYVKRCYESAANMLLVRSNFDPQTAVDNCNEHAREEYRGFCYGGAVRYSILRDPLLNNTIPFEICRRVDDQYKDSCYGGVGFGNYENYYDREVLKDYCSNAEEGYVDSCIDRTI